MGALDDGRRLPPDRWTRRDRGGDHRRRFRLFRPDLSLNGAADLLGVVATILIAWLILFAFPEAASREIGVYLALISAMAVAGGAGDYPTLRGAPLFPPTDGDERRVD